MDLPFYHINDIAYPRMTLILDVINSGYGLERYKIKRAVSAAREFNLTEDDIDRLYQEINRERDEAAERGTRTHNMFDDFVNGKSDLDDSPEALSLLAWIEDYSPTFVHTELTLYSSRLGYAGTTDAVVEIYNEELGKTELWLIDYKTSKKLNNKYGLQLTGYAMAYEEMFGRKIDRIAALRVPGGKRKKYQFKEYKRDEDALRAAVTLFYWSNPNFMKNNKKKADSMKIASSYFKKKS